MTSSSILKLLAPTTLRAELRPLQTIRENFLLDVSATSWRAAREEAIRFVAHTSKQLYASQSREEWDRDVAERDADRLLVAAFGAPPRRGALVVIETQGVRVFVDQLARQLQSERLSAYLNAQVYPLIEQLSPEDRYRLATRYLDMFRAVPGAQVDHPASFISLDGSIKAWRRVLDAHARYVVSAI